MGGRCVRLLRGDFAAVTSYSADPVATARALVEAGARALHVVDLDGARRGRPAHAATIGEIVRAVGVPVQAGGGLRTLSDLSAVLEAGAWRAIVGTAALRRPGWAAEAVRRHGADRVCVALDVRGESLFVTGWTEGVDRGLDDVLDDLATAGVRALLVTDIERDGALAGLDPGLWRRFAALAFDVTAAGGVASAADLRALAALGIGGAVIGRALYEGRVSLEEIGRLTRELDAGGREEAAPCS
jgi:phosphoribosylformimino-5-aminoimidazole carboxamide ribotide isomerase